MKRKFLYLLLTLCLLGQCLPAFAAQAPVLERIAFSGATIVGQFIRNISWYIRHTISIYRQYSRTPPSL